MMNAIYILLMAALVGSSPLKWDRSEYDFGRIKEWKGPVTHVFEFTNEGDHPIAIDRAVASCGCTTPEYTRSLVRPGESGSIAITFDPVGYSDEFSKSVAVISGGGEYRDFLVIEGKVIRKAKRRK